MATPLVATWRITCPYQIGALNHKVRFYVNIPVDPGAPPYSVADRNGVSVGWTTVADRMIAVLSGNMLDQGTAYGAVLLENRVGSLWNLRDVHTPSPSGSLTPYRQGTQFTFVFRDTMFKKMKIVLGETVWLAPQHSVLDSGFTDSHATAFIDDFSVAGTNHMFLYMVSRDVNYIAASGAFVGGTVTLNRKTRRRRGLT